MLYRNEITTSETIIYAYVLTKEMVEQQIGRKLSDKEIEEMQYNLVDDAGIFDQMMSLEQEIFMRFED